MTVAPDHTFSIPNLSQGYCDTPDVCIYGNTQQYMYNKCYFAGSLPPGNRFCNANELCINVTEVLNGSSYATLLYTVVCRGGKCGFPVVQVVAQNFLLIVTNGMCLKLFYSIHAILCLCSLIFTPTL